MGCKPMQWLVLLFAEVRMRNGLVLPRTGDTRNWGQWLVCREEADDQCESSIERVWSQYEGNNKGINYCTLESIDRKCYIQSIIVIFFSDLLLY